MNSEILDDNAYPFLSMSPPYVIVDDIGRLANWATGKHEHEYVLIAAAT